MECLALRILDLNWWGENSVLDKDIRLLPQLPLKLTLNCYHINCNTNHEIHLTLQHGVDCRYWVTVAIGWGRVWSKCPFYVVCHILCISESLVKVITFMICAYIKAQVTKHLAAPGRSTWGLICTEIQEHFLTLHFLLLCVRARCSCKDPCDPRWSTCW